VAAPRNRTCPQATAGALRPTPFLDTLEVQADRCQLLVILTAVAR
jgi:hypothetical protein